MSKLNKLIFKLLNRDSKIAYSEIKYLLGKLGFKETTKGKTSGSRVSYINEKSKHIIRLYKPHPSNELKDYVKKAIILELKEQKLI